MNASASPRLFLRILRGMLQVGLVGGVAVGAYFTRERWMPVLFPEMAVATPEPSHHAAAPDAAPPSEKVLLSEQAQKNLRMVSKPLKPVTFWKTITVPGMVIDRPGHSDRGVVAPATGIVSAIHHHAGETVKPGEPLFTVKLLSESLHQTQTDLFKVTQDIKLAEAQKARLTSSGGAVPENRIIEVNSQITRFETAVKAYRQELRTRGLTPEQIDGVAQGQFINELTIHVPNRTTETHEDFPRTSTADSATASVLEIEEVQVQLGQQVQAGQTLCHLAHHQLLAIEGQAFRDETPLLQRTIQEGWPVEVDFAEENARDWPALKQTFRVRLISNTIDPESRTFRFLVPLENQSRIIDMDGKTQILWRFRPGQRMQLRVRVEALENVFVLPPEAVVREGAETYVFRQSIDQFDRKPVHVVYQDRQSVVIANDGSVSPGVFVAQTGAAQLNRMVKSQSGTTPKGFHIHADGSVHFGSHE